MNGCNFCYLIVSCFLLEFMDIWFEVLVDLKRHKYVNEAKRRHWRQAEFEAATLLIAGIELGACCHYTRGHSYSQKELKYKFIQIEK